ncbi:uncharacterized protein EKO05_0008979 [Ascochyta rabiei]|uniref:uncharacterized protein n=1 Tax=Didymella rabiei TaxID=5454 RepID=UPI00220B3ED3|nr:uncharacterized protein EKO05_0008979 [Ascochyta rabiei]UPX18687.1 hypothetical protein EKO05_0008979 [Ascochyta rabiei]
MCRRRDCHVLSKYSSLSPSDLFWENTCSCRVEFTMQLWLVSLLFIVGCACALPTVTPRQMQGNSSCDVWKITKLIGGIEENMFIQKQEMQGLQTLQYLSTATGSIKAPANGTQSDFQLNQIDLAATLQKAIAVRENNQRLADDLASPSARGLAVVAQSQVAVMIDMMNLKGGGESDSKMLEGLVGRVKDAMAQNRENLKMADGGCRR